jgi:hypothetical protein
MRERPTSSRLVPLVPPLPLRLFYPKPCPGGSRDLLAGPGVIRPPCSLAVLRTISLCRHAVATTPAGSCGMMSFNSPTTAAFPEILPGRLPHFGLSRPAQRSRTLRPACSLSRQKRPVASKASTISLPPSPLRLLPAGTTVAGEFAPAEDARLCMAHSILTLRYSQFWQTPKQSRLVQ